jgi:ferritin
MISERIATLLNEQFHKELFSANLYLSMSSYFLAEDLDGFAHFFRLQAEEEMMHAMKQFDYLHEVDSKIEIKAIEAPQTDFKSILEIFQSALGHEQIVTRSINQIVKAALEEGDFATHGFMQWFVNEQVEEESTMRNIIAKLKLASDNQSALFLLNEDLLKRRPEEDE